MSNRVKLPENPNTTSSCSVQLTKSMAMGALDAKKATSHIGTVPIQKCTKTKTDTIIASLEKEPWWRGHLARLDLHDLMRKDGDFLVRLTEVDKNTKFAISVYSKGKTQHFVIKDRKVGYTVGGQVFKSVPELVNHYWKTGTPVVPDGPIMTQPVTKAKWELEHSQLELGAVLGTGAFGDVVRGMLTIDSNRIVVAIKTCKKANLKKEEKDKFLKEARLLRSYNHPNIISFIGIAADQEPLMLVLEFAPNGSLDKYLKKNKPTCDTQKACFCMDSAKGMEYLQTLEKPVIHRDLAARNCLLGSDLKVKITDFGLSRDTNIYSLTASRIVPVKWSAPETLRQGKYFPGSDIWSYGVLMWEIYSDGAEPYHGIGNKDLQKRILKDKYRMQPPKGMPPKMAEIMTNCWAEVHEERPRFAVIVQQLEAAKK